MRMTRVELHNIKSYAEATIEFGPGTIAICGPNGAGKTTILEAIGFALFGFLPYRNQRDFMRAGVEESAVRVTFLSPRDECAYVVVRQLRRTRRDSVVAAHYVWAMDSQERVAEQQEAVQAFLREHIGLNEYTDLASLFSEVLGVPQGRLTADFLLPPATRKAKFDPLLRVEDYRTAYERLRDALDVLEAQLREREIRLASLRPVAAELPQLEQALMDLEARQRALGEQAKRYEAESAALQEQIGHLEAAERRLRDQEVLCSRLRERVETLRQRVEDARGRVSAAQAAAEQLEKAAPGARAYQQAQATLQRLETERQEAETLKGKRAQADRRKEQLAARQAMIVPRLELAAQARTLREALVPQVEIQRHLEEQVRQATQELERIASLAQELDAFFTALREKRLAVAPTGTPPALPEECVIAAQQVRSHLEQQVRQVHDVTVLLNQRADLQKRYLAAKQELDQLAQEIAKCEALQPIAATLSTLRAERDQFTHMLAMHRAQKAFNVQSRTMAAEGLCPFFKAECPKIEAGHSLTEVIDRLISDAASQEHAAEQRRAALEQRIREAEVAERQVNRLADLRSHHQRRSAEVDQLAEEGRALTQRVGDQVAPFWDPQATRSTLDALQAQVAALQQKLASLGDPRAEFERLHAPASEHDRLAQELTILNTQLQEVEKELVSLDAALAPYAGLEARMAEQRALLAAHEQDHATHERYLLIAQELPQRQKSLQELEKDLASTEEDALNAAHILAGLRQHWDPAALPAVRKQLEEAQSSLAAVKATLAELATQTAQAQQKCDQARAVQAQMAAEEKNLAADRALHALLRFLRDAIRNAGPRITHHLIESISTEANILYGEIMGEAGSQLAVTEEYEVQLEQGGHRRTFGQLSGGEQMSAALAVRLGLLRQLSGLDIAFFDEPTQNMDVERRQNLAAQIQRIKGFSQLFIISHDDTFEQMVSSVLRVRKVGGVSVVEEV
jgi:exonuclease SbcC